tara:strand:+ start:3388 stop:3654 length:267 start_codon:yes stop_codon:yes gene_type:complete
MYDIKETIVWTDPRLCSITEIRLYKCYDRERSHIGLMLGELWDGARVQIVDPLDSDLDQFLPVDLKNNLIRQAVRDGKSGFCCDAGVL